ncbi:hypothetical protein BDV96DRAFT_650561 [Lophiotrema nucula]|uniref:F-box domain-containing protein n=1 Tax=Lophiotrema nucula TaxID=690887 RepID=A0A6A5YWN3_9PLEO|nr:hypothetical protein BDV96DRAFT_650561 [Lophiotrema nucula]
MRTKTLKVLRITMPVTTRSGSCKPPSSQAGRNARSSRAPDEVFEIYELLELILLRLPTRDLLFAQRVCHRWQSVISTSQRIQRALHFQASPIPPVADLSLYLPNPLLFDERGPFSKHIQYRGRICDWRVSSSTSAEYRIKVVLRPTTEKWEDRVKYGKASWRRMLLTQPPVTRLSLIDRRIAPDYDDCFNDDAENLDGIRMGDFLVLDDPALAGSS